MGDRVLITGATSGVGLSLTRHLAGEFEVIALGRDASKLTTLFEGERHVEWVVADLAEAGEVGRIAKQILTKHGHVPYLINNAGTNERGGTVDLGRDQLMRSLQVNALAPWQMMQMLLPGMVSHGFGRIINITSGAPLNCFPGFAAYSASKAALNAITVTAAREYADHDIKINLMSPGPVRSQMAPDAPMDPSVCHPTVDYLLGLDQGGPTGRFFWLGYEIPLFPDLEGIHWLEGRADPRFRSVL